jgi:23S rRNA (adenine2503-C2)-methyltransferase
MGCDFCATAKPGLTRNLTAGEIVEQFVHLKREAAKLNRRITSLVFMGMGEPLHNFDQVVRAIRIIGDPMVGGLGWRQITVSTVGIVPMMDRLAELDLNVHLALSLHGADDETRLKIVPMTRKYGVDDVMSALKRFQSTTGRITTVQWCLLDGVNDSDEQARKLIELMHDFRAHVNLIPHNAIGSGLSGNVYRAPPTERIEKFISILRNAGIVVHARTARGDSIAAACGQLARTLPVSVGVMH